MKSKRLPSGLPHLAVVLSGFLFAAAPSVADDSIVVSKITLPLATGAIRADVFERAERKPRPVILVLHGAGGTLLDGPEMRRVARHLAEAGNAVYLLHYFERTGTLFARDAAMQRHFPVWLQAVRDSIPMIQKLRGESSPVGIYGYSLGGFLAVFSASDNSRVGAIAEHAGGVWNGKIDRVGRMPPVLMIHGERDGRVSFSKYATPLLPVLRERATNVETRFFPEEGHGFTPAAMSKVRAEVTKFFGVHLRPKSRR